MWEKAWAQLRQETTGLASGFNLVPPEPMALTKQELPITLSPRTTVAQQPLGGEKGDTSSLVTGTTLLRLAKGTPD